MERGFVSTIGTKSEFCPKCGSVQSMISSDFKQTDKNNKAEEIVIRNYYCSVCSMFILSENANPNINIHGISIKLENLYKARQHELTKKD